MAAEAYNATGNVRTLVGNWQEEAVLKDCTGQSRCKLTTTTCARVASSEVQEPTHDRVIQHTEQLAPCNWKAHTMGAFQTPAQRSDLLSYPKLPKSGPRQAQAAQQLLQLAREKPEQEVQEANWETSYTAEFQPQRMDGIQIGTRVMKPDGSPADRDPTFLQETRLMPSAGRLMDAATQRLSSTGYVHGLDNSSTAGLTSSSNEPAAPVTIYTEAAAKSAYTGTFYGTATLGKGLMNRNDQFSKLMGDVNKQQYLL